VGWGARVILGIGPSLGRHCPLAPLALPLICAIVVLICPVLPLSLSLSLSLSSPFLAFWPSLSAPCLFFLLLVRSSLLLSPSLFFVVVPVPVSGPGCVVVVLLPLVHRQAPTIHPASRDSQQYVAGAVLASSSSHCRQQFWLVPKKFVRNKRMK
jgi:hypothetical protein